MVDINLRQPDSKFADDGVASSLRGVTRMDSDEVIALIELLRTDDLVRLNQRRRPIHVVDITDTREERNVYLRGNGTSYTLKLSRETGEMSVRVGQSSNESVDDIRVENRNPLNVREYERLLDEEIESTAPTDYFNVVSNIPHATLTTEVEYNEEESRAIRWALSKYLDCVAESYFQQSSEYNQNIWDDARTLWERFRHDSTIVAYGSEMGKVGAVLDYSIEDCNITLPENVFNEVDRLRASEDVSMIEEEPPWPQTVPRLVEE